MDQTLTQEISSTDEGRRLLQEERAILEVSELIWHVMKHTSVSRSELAARLRKSKGYITQLLDGRANMTIRTIANVFGALGSEIHFQCGRGSGVSRPPEVHWHFMTGVSNEALDDLEHIDICSSLSSSA